MAVEYCSRGHHYVDLDENCEGTYLPRTTGKDKTHIMHDVYYCCWDHLTEKEQDELEASQ